MTPFGLLTISLVLCSLSQAASEVDYIYITSDSNVPCTEQPCQRLTLSQFATSLSSYDLSNTTVFFSPGTHYLNGVNLTLTHSDNFVMKSENSTAQIQCASNSLILVSQSQHFQITNLDFVGCRGNQVKGVQEFVVTNTKFDGRGETGTALEPIETTAQITNSTFISNKGTIRKCANHNIPGKKLICPEINDIRVGGAIISTNSKIDISRCKFGDNEAFIGGAIVAEQNSTVNVNELSVFTNNNAMFGGSVFSNFSTIIFKASKFQSNSVTDVKIPLLDVLVSRAGEGAVLYSSRSNIIVEGSKFRNNMAIDAGVAFLFNSVLSVRASEFYNNSVKRLAGALFSVQSNVTIQASRFHNNSGSEGGAVYFFRGTNTVDKCNFSNNSARAYAGALVADNTRITIIGSNFYNNNATFGGGALRSFYQSNVTIKASYFHNNMASQGGALYSEQSNVTIEASDFQRNRATVLEGNELLDSRVDARQALHSFASNISIHASTSFS